MQGKWFVTLKGEEFDLQELVKFNSPPKIEIKKDNEAYYLGSEKFNLCKEAREVEKIGKEIINVLNGIAKLHFQNWKDINLDKPIFIDTDGKRHLFLLCEPEIIRIKESIELKVTKADGTIITLNDEPSFIESTSKITNRDSRLEKALRIYGSREHNWANLYIIYEIIETDVGGKNVIDNKGWMSKSKIKIFKHTANSTVAIGDDARHHDEINIPPAKPMLLSEAEELIANLLKKWIETKQ